MSNRKTVHGYVVDHKDSGARYAVSPQNFNPKIHTKVRELEQHETVLGFRPRRILSNPVPTPRSQAAPKAPSSEGSKKNIK